MSPSGPLGPPAACRQTSETQMVKWILKKCKVEIKHVRWSEAYLHCSRKSSTGKKKSNIRTKIRASVYKYMSDRHVSTQFLSAIPNKIPIWWPHLGIASVFLCARWWFSWVVCQNQASCFLLCLYQLLGNLICLTPPYFLLRDGISTQPLGVIKMEVCPSIHPSV